MGKAEAVLLFTNTALLEDLQNKGKAEARIWPPLSQTTTLASVSLVSCVALSFCASAAHIRSIMTLVLVVSVSHTKACNTRQSTWIFGVLQEMVQETLCK